MPPVSAVADKHRRNSVFVLICVIAFCSFCVASQTTGATGAPVYVVLWFDTEDYTRTDPDTILVPLCRILENRGIRATFKMVGQKARNLEQRGQKDVIAALKRQDIGFHTTFHSLPPVPTAYLDRLDWSDGVAEFLRREDAGFQDTKRIFGRTPVCYGQPGSAWAPQVFGALHRWKVPMYLDEGIHVGLKGNPFYYGGVLNVYDMADRSTRMNLEGADDFEKGKSEFRKIHEKLVSEGGGLISIYYHPNEFDCTEFWDAVIWARGAYPQNSEWKQPRKRSPQSREQALRFFDSYLESIRQFPDVRFVTATDLVRIYADGAVGRRFVKEEISRIARSLADDATFQRVGNVYLSPAECFSLLLAWYLKEPGTAAVAPIMGLLGPVRRENADSGARIEEWQFKTACRDTLDYMQKSGHVPNVVWIGPVPVTPLDFLASLAARIENETERGSVLIRKGNSSVEIHAADEGPGLFDWLIFPPGFRAPHVVDLAKLQCWSLKPAYRNDGAAPPSNKGSAGK